MVQGGGLPPGPSEGGRRPTGDGPGVADGKAKRFSARRKVKIVLRLWRGEDLELLSRELGVTAARSPLPVAGTVLFWGKLGNVVPTDQCALSSN